VVLLALVVGLAVTSLAARAGAEACGPVDGGPVLGSRDLVCAELVATLSERVGLAAAAVAAILVLTVVGLSRLQESGGPG
jgi:hypothetical protein